MAIVDKLSLKSPFGGRQKQQAEEERLVQLFKNRAGLKKAHATLQDEFYELKERLKQQEGATAKARAEYEALETLLGSPDAGSNALVYFQLRGLWRVCFQQLEQFSAELERQQEERERRKQAYDFSQALKARLAEIDGRLAAAEAEVEREQQAANDLALRVAKLRGFWNYFKRRKLVAQSAHQVGNINSARLACEQIREEHARVEQEQAPAFGGLSVDGRRAINLATIAYALILGARMSMQGLALRSRESMNRRVQEAQFGSRSECQALMVAIGQTLTQVKARAEIASEIKACVELLREVAQYRADGDTVPLADSLAGVVPASPDGNTVLSLSAPQILADDYWNVYRVLLS